ncbi:hypothetical protein DFA_00596 [Cavenderia fasciculata]|uniref:Major facilitator superfamily (MFS) profile domain-containing protein n=1 Tax=Cavenderia fasciculata TaxID=261658 RepID=F4PSP1_CACFS|nr:uncharacterized protein DFA_00596 [Cavenderia fasciculata]EGG20733.1 hypothetical protein DFA_00596 [Cavenderia fasciculata]|eukprot:XP_004358583.1 hypothetical protein DFA_00596 [Cavenderia fasciculata]
MTREEKKEEEQCTLIVKEQVNYSYPLKDKESLLKEKLGVSLCMILLQVQYFSQTSFTPWMYEGYVRHYNPNYSQSQIDSQASHLQSIVDALPFASGFFFCPLIGMIADQKGRKKLAMLAISSSLIDAIVTIVSVKYWVVWPMFCSSFIRGLCIATTPLFYAYFADITSQEERPRIYSLLGTTLGIGTICGPMIGMGFMNWEPIYLKYFGCVLLVLAISILVPLKESYHFRNGIRVGRGSEDQHADGDDECQHSNSSPSKKNKQDASKNLEDKKGGSKNPVRSIINLFKISKFIGLYSIVYFTFSFSFMDSTSTQYNYSNIRFGWGPDPNNILTSLIGVSLLIWSFLSWILKYKSERVVYCLAFLVSSICHILYALSVNEWMFSASICFGSFSMFILNVVQSTLSKAAPSDMQATVLSGVVALSSASAFCGALASENIFSYFISSRSPIYFPGMHFIIDGGVMFISFGLSFILLRVYPLGCQEENGNKLELVLLLSEDQREEEEEDSRDDINIGKNQNDIENVSSSDSDSDHHHHFDHVTKIQSIN